MDQPIRIVLDAGHGGKDSGAVYAGLKEKNLTLDITHRVQKLLMAHGCKVFLTRTRDEFVSLLDRAEITSQCKADLFVSIHVNASPFAKAAGVETYYLNGDRFLLPQINENFFFATTEHDLELIKFAESCLAQKVNASKKMANTIHTGLLRVLRSQYQDVNDRGLRGGAFCGLIRSSSPAILMEVAFLSNPIEKERLKTAEYRQMIAQGIFEGILNHLQN